MGNLLHDVLTYVRNDGGLQTYSTRTNEALEERITQMYQHVPDDEDWSFQCLLESLAEQMCSEELIDTPQVDEYFIRLTAENVLRLCYEEQEETRDHHAMHDQVTGVFSPQGVPPPGFNNELRLGLVRTTLDLVGIEAYTSELNTRDNFNPDAAVDGRDGSSDYETWLVEEMLPSFGQDALDRVNAGLAEFLSSNKNYPFRVEMREFPLSPKAESSDGRQGKSKRHWYDVSVKLYLVSEDSEYVIHEPVNIKNVKLESKDPPANSGGARTLRYAMLGVEGESQIETTSLIRAVQESLQTGVDTPYGVRDCDYWFWAFEKKPGGNPVERIFVSSLLGIDPSAGAVLPGKNREALKYNAAQTFPYLQVDYEVAAMSMSATNTALEARDRFWQWWGTCYDEVLERNLIARAHCR